MTIHSVGTSLTDRPARYAKQLISHMSRRVGGEWDATTSTGWLQFPKGRAELRCKNKSASKGPCELVISLIAEDEEAADSLEAVLERHLVKFGVKDGLTMSWIRA